MDDETTISNRIQQTQRAFHPHEGTALDMYEAYGSGHRIWLDNGQQKQAVRTCTVRGSGDDMTVAFYLRSTDGRHIEFQNSPEDIITWYEEAIK